MGAINIDTSSFRGAKDLDGKNQALWTFRIQNDTIHCWGRYREAASTAEKYALQHGFTQGTIRLLECSGAWRGVTLH